MKAALTADRAHVMCRISAWSEILPIEKLASRIAFYRRMAEHPTQGWRYAENLRALLKVQQKLQGDGS